MKTSIILKRIGSGDKSTVEPLMDRQLEVGECNSKNRQRPYQVILFVSVN
jgi:hypothetical protein